MVAPIIAIIVAHRVKAFPVRPEKNWAFVVTVDAAVENAISQKFQQRIIESKYLHLKVSIRVAKRK